MAKLSDGKDYWELAPIQIAGVERTAELYAAGRIEEARDHFISAARAVFTRRWPSVRKDRLRRLGEALDTERFPSLATIASGLREESPEAAAGFLDYLRRRTKPDVSRHVHAPQATDVLLKRSRSDDARCFGLWSVWTATQDDELKARFDAKMAEMLHPTVLVGWHETNYPWVKLVFSALHHGGLDDTTLCELIGFGLDYAEFVNDFAHHIELPQTSIGGNWIFYWALSGLTAVCVFPEFRRSPALQNSLLARFDDELSKQVMADGSMIEGVPGYQNCCLNMFGEFLTICKEHELQLPERVPAAIEKLIRGSIKLLKPDGREPMFGDSQDDGLAGLVRAIGPYFNFPELRWVLSHGAEGSPPSYTSAALDRIGYYALRDGWGEDALCLVFDGGRMGQAHAHEDKLSFELNAYGRPFIVDPGVYGYCTHWLREWLVVAQAHNLILLDGLGQCRWRQDRDQWYSPMPIGNRCEFGETWDIVEASFDGPYERADITVVQHRRVIFHKGDLPFWWITDRLEGPGSFDVAELFHFAHDIERVEAIPGGVRTCIPGGPDLAIICIRSCHGESKQAETPETLLYRGEMDPPRGWVSPARMERAAAWELHFSSRTELPLRRDFLLLPWREELPDDLNAALDLTPGKPTLSLHLGASELHIALPEA